MNGVNKVVHYLATYGVRAGLDVEVWGIANTPEVRHEHTYTLRLFPPFRNRFFPGPEITAAINCLSNRDTVAHLHSVFLPELFACSRHLRRNGIPWVLTPHGGYTIGSMQKNYLAKRIYMSLFEKTLLSQAKALHAISEQEQERLITLTGHKSVFTIPNGHEIAETAHSPSRTRRPNLEPIFVFCGRLDQRHKGLDLLLDGFSQYRADGGRGALWMIGDGPDRSQLEAQATRLGLGATVSFFGPLLGAEKIQRLLEADVFVHTSRWEGLPTAVLEAASLGLPVLVSRETGLAEAVELFESGYVLHENITHQIKESLAKAAQDFKASDLTIKGASARAMVIQKFRWPNIVQKMLKLYQL